MDITTIIPIHEFNDSVEKLLDRAVSSVEKQEPPIAVPLIIVHTPEIKEQLETFFKKRITNTKFKLVENTGDSNFQSQINLGVENVETEFFSILEFDDEISETYYKQFQNHIDHYKNVDVFLPIVVETDEGDKALKLTNEYVWSKAFVGENGTMGYLNTKSLNQYTDFKICGSVIRKSEFINVGGLKSKIILSFQYEFLLRLLGNGNKVYTVPKIGCRHVVTREGSLFDTYQKTLSMSERKFWFETAKAESNFFTDRDIDTSLLNTIDK